ncbi:MAG: exo-alpha-sialidase [Bacteroidales bacterium]|nr:exo-alpha-sialidase [Bacteroidales bacterium]
MRFPRIFSLIALLGLVACGGAPRDVLYECVVRDAGYDSVAVYRIPGLVTSNAGTLVAVYDIRHNNVRDLPEDIDIGVSRSTDGGRTWGSMIVAIDMKQWGGLPDIDNGVGDPSILVDRHTGRLFIVAAWTHGLPLEPQAWFTVGSGLSPEETAQIMLVYSDDDGLTWSEPRSITPMVKNPAWYFTFQGPGRGIQMEDGTLVFAAQYQDEIDRTPHSTIMYSCDHGDTWTMGTGAAPNTTEAQVAELEPGVLMLNMRNDRRTGRVVRLTRDMGRTWEDYESETLVEPVCMASLLKVPSDENSIGRDILLFSNPNHPTRRINMTLRASLDGGRTWPAENSIVLDTLDCWGYSCLTMIDQSTVGILYESSRAHIFFQAIPLSALFR